jgi:nucleotide-binding universal stress UspA family protein
MRRIVVGVDGSAPSITAVKWAATEAALRNAALRNGELGEVELQVLFAYQTAVPGADFSESVSFQRAADEQATAVVEAALAVAVDAARPVAGTLAVSGSAVRGYPARALLKAAEDADLLVVGNRGRGGFQGLLSGSVSAQAATYAPGPVVVVRGRADNAMNSATGNSATGNSATGPIVVGVDGSHPSEVAVRAAVQEAALRRRSVIEIVTTYPSGLPPAYDRAQLDADLRLQQQRLLTAARASHPDLPDVLVEQQVIEGGPAAVLTGKSMQAQLVVVGARGHGGFEGLLLGSVGLELLHHADCPVLIAR